MNMMDQNFENELSNAVTLAVIKDYEQLEKNMIGYDHEFSHEFYSRMDSIIYAEKIKRSKKRMHFSLLIAAILIMIASTIVLASDSIREKIGTMIITFYQECADVNSISIKDSEDNDVFSTDILKYIPAGFILDSKENDPVNVYYEDYYNTNGNVFYYTQSKKEGTNISISYDGKNKEKIKIKNTILYYISDGEMNTLLFENDAYIYQLTSDMDKEFIIEIYKNNFK